MKMWVLAVAVLVYSLAEAQDVIDPYRAAMTKEFQQLRNAEWELLRTEKNAVDTLIMIQYTRRDKDTVWVAQIHHSRTNPADKRWHVELIKSYITPTAFHYVYYDKNRKPMFHYEFPRRGEYSFNFLFGWYCYGYFYGLLSEPQRYFFEAHRDSLTRIGGNNLPPLPKGNAPVIAPPAHK